MKCPRFCIKNLKNNNTKLTHVHSKALQTILTYAYNLYQMQVNMNLLFQVIKFKFRFYFKSAELSNISVLWAVVEIS